MLAGRLVMAISALATTSLLARMLNVELVGTYFLAVSIVLALTTAAQLGMDRAVVRLIAESITIGRGDLAVLLVKRILTLSVGAALVIGLAILLGGGEWLLAQLFNSTQLAAISAIIAVWILLATLQKIVSESFRGFKNIPLATIFGGPFSNLLTFCFLVCIWWKYGSSNLHEVASITVVGLLISAMVSMYFLIKKLRAFPIDMPKHVYGKSYGSIMVVSLPLLVVGISDLFLSQADLLILGILRPGEEVALYGAALRLIVFVGMPLMMVNAIIQPWIASLYKAGNKFELEHLLRTTALISGMPSLIILVVMAVYGKWILDIVFGSAFQNAATVLQILAIGRVVHVWTGSCGMLLAMTGHQVVMMKISLFSGVLMLALLLLMIEKWGLVGCALAATISISLQNIAMLIVGRNKTGIWTHITFRPDWQVIAKMKG